MELDNVGSRAEAELEPPSSPAPSPSPPSPPPRPPVKPTDAKPKKKGGLRFRRRRDGSGEPEKEKAPAGNDPERLVGQFLSTAVQKFHKLQEKWGQKLEEWRVPGRSVWSPGTLLLLFLFAIDH
eukprot:Hpha_TRINITY_DN3492_c0_g1::TRINITY_DN3492_c0_g1_i1::g.32650::m.32650